VPITRRHKILVVSRKILLNGADAVAPHYGALPPSTEKSRLAPPPRPPPIAITQ
jgi:hypothetical protein